MLEFKIKEALEIKCAKDGLKRKEQLELRRELSELLWVNSTKLSRIANICNLLSGKTSVIPIEWVGIICEKLDCTPDFLFGFNEKN